MIKDITNIKDPLVIQIIQMLYAAPRNKQDIAKRTETNIDIVHRIYQYYFSSKSKMEDVKSIIESAPTSSIENKIEDSDKKKEVSSQLIKEEIDSEDPLIIVPAEEKKHRFSRKFTDDQVLEALSKVENGESVDEVAKNMGADRATIYNWAKKMSIVLPKKKRAAKKKIAEKRAEESEVKEKVKEEIKEEVKEEVVTTPLLPNSHRVLSKRLVILMPQ